MKRFILFVMIVVMIISATSCRSLEKSNASDMKLGSSSGLSIYYENSPTSWIWEFSLQNHYAIIAESDTDIEIGKFSSDLKIGASTIVSGIQQYCYNDRYICAVECLKVKATDSSDSAMTSLASQIEADNSHYYIVDTQNQKTYGPYDSIEVFEQQCASLNVGVLCAWIADQPPEGLVFANSSSEQSESTSPQMTVKGNVYIKDSGGNVILDKSDVISAATIPDPNNKNKFVIQITLNDSGRKKFAEATAKLTGQTIDVYIDNTLISSPEVICTLNSSAFDISGFTDNQQADEYTKQINLG